VVGVRLHDLFIPIGESEAEKLEKLRLRLGVPTVRVARRSLDARKGRPLGHHLQVATEEAPLESRWPAPRLVARPLEVVVVGSGPAGTFAALRLAQAGARVTLVEQGRPVQPRRHDLARLTQRGELDDSSNYCFGEGGAGTFSDGKLYTRVKDRAAVRTVLATLVEHGADESIVVESRAHIGSNRLPKILVALRQALIGLGVQYHWEQKVESLDIVGGRVRGVRCASGLTLSADHVVLAAGHSARSLFEALHRQGVALERKAFSVGARVEHRQPFINRAQYGDNAEHPALPPAFYELTAQARGRGVYSFCMCPGGWIVNSASEAGALATNGMSLKRRDSPFANSALVVSVEPRDFPEGVLGGLALQRSIERAAFVAGGEKFFAPTQLLEDFLARRSTAQPLDSTYRPGVVGGDVRALLPAFVGDALADGLQTFARRMPGFLRDAQLVGVEPRTSSPVRVLRNEQLESPSHAGLHPVGEGAGYAGGIVSAAIDGLRAAEAILQSW
jgi:uncharacterized FAD-dependent dehydrogenase